MKRPLLVDGPEVSLLAAQRAYKKLNSSSLVWLMGRHFVRDENAEETFQAAVASETDTAKIQGNALVAKVKIQKTLSLHLSDHIMNLHMRSNSTTVRSISIQCCS